MSLRSYTAYLVPVALTLVSFEVNAAFATEQTGEEIYEFSIPYTVFTDIDPTFRPDLNISKVTDRGESNNAAYGLTNFLSNAYAQAEFRGTTISSTFNADPAVFGIEGEILGDRFFGGPNELFTRSSGSFETDLVEGVIRGTGNLVVLDGTGIFENATGTVTFTQSNRINPANPTATAEGMATLNFSVRTPKPIPEPTSMGVLAFGASVGFLRKKAKQKVEI